MPIRKDARLHMLGVRTAMEDGLNPGDLVSQLPGLWSHIGLIVQFRNLKHVLYFDIDDRQRGFFQNLFPLEVGHPTEYFVIPSAEIVPLITSDTFGLSHPGKNGIALIGDKLACVGWINHSYALFDAKDGSFVDRSFVHPYYVTSWDILTKDIDESVVSLLEVRPD